MPPKIAILGWGSLLWEDRPEFDEWHDDWRPDGPSLKLEFSRVSSTRVGALTLVVDPEHGLPTRVAWCLSKRNDTDDAVADLRCREGCPIRYIARMNVAASVHDQSLAHEGTREIAPWARARGFNVVAWTSLPSNFAIKLKKPFSIQEAIEYLGTLEAPAKVKAAEYIWRAPEFVRTPLRRAVERDPWFHGGETSDTPVRSCCSAQRHPSRRRMKWATLWRNSKV
jgi:hypothetical protein